MENNGFDNIPNKFGDTTPINEPTPIPDPFAEPQPQAQQSSFNGGTPPQAPPPRPMGKPEPEMGIKDWLITFLLMAIPCVNIIMLIIWAASDENKTRRNFARAYFIVMAIGIVIGILFSVALTGFMMSLGDAMMGW